MPPPEEPPKPDAATSTPASSTAPALPTSSPPPVPDPVREAVEAARRIAEDTSRHMRATSTAIQTLANRPPYTPPPAPPTPDAADDDEDLDPAVRKAVDTRLKKVFGAIDQVYTRDRTEDLRYRAELERREVERAYPWFKDIAGEVDEYMRDVDLQLRATPGAYREAAFTILGKRAAKEREEQIARTPAVSGESRIPPAPTSPTFTREEREISRDRLGIDLTEQDDIFAENRPVSIHEYRARRAAQ